MNYCPDCGKGVVLRHMTPDVPTDHSEYSCENGHGWIETTTKDGELLHITRKGEEDETN